jgi:hypothetical protein
MMGHRLKISLLLCAALLNGCAYNWVENQVVDTAEVHKVETELAAEICSKLLGGVKRACAIRLTNMDSKQTRCVMVVQPGDRAAIGHEVLHCLGWDH